MQMTHTLLFAAGIIGSLSLIAISASANTISTQDFVKKASIANEFEIESSKLALEKSQNSEIKTFAERMIDDHTKTGSKMKDALKSSESHATPELKLDAEHQAMMDKLSALSKDDFNHQYIVMQTGAHKKAVDLFTDYSEHGDDASLKEFATATLPALQDHLNHVKRLNEAH